MKFRSLLLYTVLGLLLPTLVHAEDLTVTSVSLAKPWQPSATQNITLEAVLPKNFHAYKDQFRIINIKPEGYKAGEIKIKPEVEFYDKFSKKKRTGLFEKGNIELIIEAPNNIEFPRPESQF